MNKKEELKQLLREFSKEELMEIFGNLEEKPHTQKIDKNKKNRRRGKGTRSKKKNPQKEGASRSTKTYGQNKGNPCRSGSINTSNSRPNKFDDFMQDTLLTHSERQELEEASKADEQNKNLQRSPRTRQPATLEVKCRTCGVEDTVAASTIYDQSRWKCNQCSSKACE